MLRFLNANSKPEFVRGAWGSEGYAFESRGSVCLIPTTFVRSFGCHSYLLQLFGLSPVFFGFPSLAEFFISERTIFVGAGVIRLQPDGLGVVRDGSVVLLQVIVSISAVVIGAGMIRFQLDDFGVIGDGFVVLLQLIH